MNQCSCYFEVRDSVENHEQPPAMAASMKHNSAAKTQAITLLAPEQLTDPDENDRTLQGKIYNVLNFHKFETDERRVMCIC